MCRLLLMTCFVLYCHPYLMGQNLTREDAVLRFLGSDDLHEYDADEVENLENLFDDPIRINIVSENDLRSSGVFTAYQAAVIADYIGRHGPIHSLLELSLLDGLGEGFVSKAAPFISLSAQSNASSRVRNELAVRSVARWQESTGSDVSYGLKYRIRSGERLSATVAASRSYGDGSWLPSAFSGSFAWKSGRMPVSVVAGDFNARFGQGLTLWNNSFINTLTGPDSFMKRPSGITQPWSFTGNGAMTGLAVEAGAGHWLVSSMAVFPGLKDAMPDFMPAFNLAWYGRSGQISMTTMVSLPLTGRTTVTAAKTGLDAAFCICGVNVFGEVSYDWLIKNPSVLAGTRFRMGERTDMAVQARAFVNDLYGLACCGAHAFGTSDLTWVVDAVSNSSGLQVKGLMTYEKVFGSNWKLRLRLSERIRTYGLPFRTDARADVVYTAGNWYSSVRLNVLTCDGIGLLSYVEGGHSGKRLTAYIRQGIFFIDDWDDRIYVYERDAPGSFNVPAMYGRGLWTSITASFSPTSWLRMYARACSTCYPFMEKKKLGKAELKLHLQWRF